MTADALNIINDVMDELNINYEFMEWTADPVYPYFVGEYQEVESMSEDGLQEATFFLNGFSRASWDALETAKASIENYFTHTGKTAITSNGNGVAVFYANSYVIPQENAELKRIQITLKIKEWKVI